MPPELLEQALRSAGPLRTAAAGRSMMPLIRPGDPVALASCRPEDVRCGDIVMFRLEDRYVLHRVHRVQGRTPGLRLVTKGDASLVFDPPVDGGRLVGRVVCCAETAAGRLRWRLLDSWARAVFVRLPELRRRLSGSRPYVLLFRVKKAVLGPASLADPLIAALGRASSRWSARTVRWRGGKDALVFRARNFGARIVELAPDRADAELLDLWRRAAMPPAYERAEDLAHDLWRHPRSEDPLCLAAERGGRLIGVIAGTRPPAGGGGARVGSVEALAVDPESRRRRVGTALLEALADRFRGGGLRQVRVCASSVFLPGLPLEDDAGASGFFVRAGFVPVGFLDEMVWRRERVSPAREGARCVPLDPQAGGELLEFMEREAPHAAQRVRRLFPPRAQDAAWEGFLTVREHGRLAGFCHYVRADRLSRAMAARYLRARWGPRLEAGQELCLINHFFASGEAAARELLEGFLSEASKGPRRVVVAVTGAQELYVRLGFAPASRFACLGRDL